jgi:ectoine hydroxylase-related dioxygenase (phytanoyl-CoA dioxygenase family)
VVGIELSVDGLDGIAFGRGATSDELAALEERGFVIVPALLPEATVEALIAEFERLVAENPRSRLHELGTRRAKATNANDVFAVCWRHRVVLDAATEVLGSTFQVGRVDLRDPASGHGEQRLHPDHGPKPMPGITATWFLDAFAADNGATRVLPGSHHSLPANSEVTEAGLYTIPNSEVPVAGEVVALGPSGSLLVRDARLFHAGGRNTTTACRRSALVFFAHDIPEPEVWTLE